MHTHLQRVAVVPHEIHCVMTRGSDTLVPVDEAPVNQPVNKNLLENVVLPGGILPFGKAQHFSSAVYNNLVIDNAPCDNISVAVLETRG